MSGATAAGAGDGAMGDTHMLDTPDYTDSESNPTGANSVAGDAHDGRKKRWEGNALRKSVFGKKHDRLGENKEDDTIKRFR
ncbi:chromatin remodeling complex Adenosinetriphosphatase, partial [Teratosphaeriaceae sp. CCFEE 6253]